MAKIDIKNLTEGYQSIISNGRHSIVGDEPISSKGTDKGMDPTELLLAGLALCKVATVRYIARKKGWDHLIRDIDSNLEQKVKRGKEGLTTHIQIQMKIEGDLSEEQKQELFTAADSCYVHRMLNGQWEIGGIEDMT